MQKAAFITGNDTKWQIAENVFAKYGVELERSKLDTPEIQAMTSSEVAAFSAQWAAEKLSRLVIVSDVSYHIAALGGFPGPYIKYINKWLTSADLANLMSAHDDRSVYVNEVIGVCAPGEEAKMFMTKMGARLAQKPKGSGYAIDQLLIWDGFDDVQATYTPEQMLKHWQENLGHYHEAAKYLASLPAQKA